MLEIREVSKSFGEKRALDKVSMTIADGTIYGLLGPNGAGKTTLIRIITGITMPDSGEALLDGKQVSLDMARRIGYLPEERGLYKKMRVGEQIQYFARLRGMSQQEAREETEWWLKRFEIETWKMKKIEELSKGMAQKVQFITTVIHRPQLLVLDEPFSGFDPVNALQIEEEIKRLNREGTTVILSTHDMESVETLCKEISLINQGRIVLQGNVEEIKNREKENLFEVTLLTAEGKKTEVLKKADGETNNEFLARISKEGEVTEFKEKLPSMNEIFIKTVS
ncbi:MAG: ATP-binding cassette domain-containing protein [Paludibacteraceae bacterium]|nr:ATP-binding cassette domain-containing protein [Paludibacteraceae bacterium]